MLGDRKCTTWVQVLLITDPDYEGNLRFTQNEYQQARMFLSLVYIFRGQFF